MDEKRRLIIKQLGFTFGSILLIPGCIKNISPWYFFNENEAKTVIALAEQIIPADDDPGATYAGVVYYIDKQLDGPLARFRDQYREGLANIDQISRESFQKPFFELELQAQFNFMTKMETGSLPNDQWKSSPQKSFFNLLVSNTMQGFYGSPRHGGNKNGISFKMLKLDYPYVLGQNRY